MSDEEIVGVRRGATREEVSRAYRKRAILTHPDKGGDAEAFRNLTAARDRLLETAPEAPKEKRECPVCRGSGKVRVTVGVYTTSLTCAECAGEGEV